MDRRAEAAAVGAAAAGAAASAGAVAGYVATLLRRAELENPTIVVITDRNDLDDQLFGTFSMCRDLIRQTPVQADSRDDLQSALSRASGGVIFTTIQKFSPATGENIYPMLSNRRNIVVIADEAYEDLVYEGEHFSIASIEGMFERTITSFTFSKSYAMTGWRLGYTVAAEPWMTGLRKTTLYTSNGVSTPTQWAGLAAFNTRSDWLENNRVAYRKRRDLLFAGLNELGLDCEKPAGAFYAFPDVSRISSDSREAADILLDRAQVSTVPGIVFGPDGEGHLRFSFSTSIETIEAGLESLRHNL